LAGGLILLFTASLALAADLLQIGSKGPKVSEVQSYLHQLSYLKYSPTGYYGKATAEAVKSFQIEYGLQADGKAGPETQRLLSEAAHSRNKTVSYTVKAGDTMDSIADQYDVTEAAIIAKNNLSSNQVVEGQNLLIPLGETRVGTVNSRDRQGIQAVPWSIVDQLWKTGQVARVIDVETGKSFLAQRYYGYYHADIEPLTKQDTQTLFELYGYHWSWDRRAVVVQIRNLYIAASINGMPHGGEAIFDNNFRGQICAHFLGSKVHADGGVDPQHMAMIQRAANTPLSVVLERNDARERVAPAVAVPATGGSRTN
jgi:peptidoglycan hydrolase-like protein with peptidoglycan-binding domain